MGLKKYAEFVSLKSPGKRKETRKEGEWERSEVIKEEE